MGTVAEAQKYSLDELTEMAIASLNRASEDLVSWVDLVREPENPWAFTWSEDSVRGANVGAANCILGVASPGLLDRQVAPAR